jgi:hypothetical protein
MELFLNLLWVLIAAGAIGVWRICWQCQKPRTRRDPFREWTAIGCALVLLFFAVSLTDDLYAAAMLLDECSANRRQSICSHHLEQSKQVVKKAGSAILLRTASAESPLIFFRAVSVRSYAVKFLVHDLSEGRAPPALLL